MSIIDITSHQQVRRAALLIGAFLALVASAGYGTVRLHRAHGGAADTTLRVGFISATSPTPTGPEGWALRQGILKRDLRASGVTQVRFINFANGPDLNEALSAGALDVGMLGDTPALVARSAGVPTRAINQSQVGMDVWLVARKDGPHALSDLKGKTVATSKGSYMSRYLIEILQQQGLSKSVKFVHLLPSDAEAALTRGDIAAYAAPIGTGPLLVSHGFAVIDRASQHPGLTGSSVTVVTTAYLAAYPNFPAAWNHIRDAGLTDLNAHSENYYQFAAQVSHLPEPIIKVSYPLSTYAKEPFTRAGLTLLDGAKQFLVAQRLAPQDFVLRDWTVQPPAQTASAK